jgi:hypothetical protein
MVLAHFPAGDPRADLRAAHEARLLREQGQQVRIVYNPRRDDFEVVDDDE